MQNSGPNVNGFSEAMRSHGPAVTLNMVALASGHELPEPRRGEASNRQEVSIFDAEEQEPERFDGLS